MDNRTVILTQAIALFAERGYAAVGVQEIVNAAGVTKPTLYHYFGSKRGVLETLIAEGFEPFLGDLRDAAEYRRDLNGTLQRIVRTYFAFIIQQPALYRMQLSVRFTALESEAAQVIAPVVREQWLLLEQVFIDAANENGNLRGRERRYAATLLGVIDAYVFLDREDQFALDDQAVWQAVQQFSYGIYS